MKPFSIEIARTAGAAVLAGARDGSRYIGGGTNLVDLMKLGIETPDHLVGVREIDDGALTPASGGGVTIDAAMTNSHLAAHPVIRERYPVLARAVLAGASPQIRNMATCAGNLLQRPRCPYFYNPAQACNRRAPGTGCDAIDGFDRMHAILGGSDHCIAVHPSDMAVALTLLDAEIVTARAGAAGRRMAMHDLLRLPGDTPHIETNLAHGELIVAIGLPPPPAGLQRYRKVRDRASFAFALVSLASAIEVRAGRVTAARFALGGVAPRPWRSVEAEAFLAGRTADQESFEKTADMLLAGAAPRKQNAFKVDLVKRLVVAAGGAAAREAA